ncbi:DUF551 domain-containing protein [Escherichia coli]|nr:DUF551 domain-containing protein [Escherichia coli]EKE4274057.1 DUF551 domain-containing protein [Escherichia coli]
MSTITKERIELFIKSPLENGLTRGEQMELARIALASLEAEPVAWLHSDNGLGIPAITRSKNVADSWLSKGWYVQPLYIAKPVPVVPDARPSLNNGIVGFDEGWNACRAAMLQSGNFRENKNSSTNNFREIAETSTNYPVIPSEVLSAILKVAKIRADFDDFDGDRRGIGDCLDEAEQELIVTINKYASQLAVVPVGLDERAAFNAWNNDENLPIAGVGAKNAAWLAWQARAELGRSLAVNSPVIPDSWISCSERMPAQDDWILIYSKHGEYMAGQVQGEYVELSDGTLSWLGNALFWMQLPEPPQEVK